MRQPVIPALWPKGPKLRIAPNQNEEASKEKTRRPHEANKRPTLSNRSFGKKKNAREQNKETRQMMVEFALALVRKQFCLPRGIRWVVHWHRHSRVHLVHGMLLRANNWLKTEQTHHKNQRQNQEARLAQTSRSKTRNLHAASSVTRVGLVGGQSRSGRYTTPDLVLEGSVIGFSRNPVRYK